nr:hypothetical protein [uncultured Ruminococcus sp.]
MNPEFRLLCIQLSEELEKKPELSKQLGIKVSFEYSDEKLETVQTEENE